MYIYTAAPLLLNPPKHHIDLGTGTGTGDREGLPSSIKIKRGMRFWPSIEMEPKTLTFHQINYAREAALYVVSTKSEEEAIRIFTAGLKPVQTNKAVRTSSSSDDDDVDLDGGCKDGRRGRRRPSFLDDIATAPF